jgi:hypothetical protein
VVRAQGVAGGTQENMRKSLVSSTSAGAGCGGVGGGLLAAAGGGASLRKGQRRANTWSRAAAT